MFSKHGQVERAMEMFTDLRQFAEAKAWAEAWARSNSGAAAPQYAAKYERHLAQDLCRRGHALMSAAAPSAAHRLAVTRALVTSCQ